ncbi:hypothetical protein HID58_041849, partial [Brassica napus]
ENLCLKKEKSWLKDTMINLRKELDDERKKEANTSDLKNENERLVVQIEARSSDLNAKLEHHYKTVRMLMGLRNLIKSSGKIGSDFSRSRIHWVWKE